MLARSRWKYPKAKRFALENPISDIYKQMQSMPLLKCYFNPTSVILQANSNQSDLLNGFCIGRPILAGPGASLSCSDGIGNCPTCQEKADTDEEMVLYELMFEEAFFLSHELKCLQVFNKMQQEKDEVLLDDESFWQLMSLHKHGFPYYYMAYSHLRRKNWIVRSGLQYGVHYMAYRHHPSNVHADYSVLVVPEWEKQLQLDSWSHMQGIIRLCGNVAKTLLLLHIARTDMNDQHPRCLRSYTVKEMEVKRWLPQKHRMDNCATSTNSLIESSQVDL